MIARVSIFVAVTFALSWACQTPAILALREGYAPRDFLVLMMAVGSAGPSLVALWFNVLERRKRTSVTQARTRRACDRFSLQPRRLITLHQRGRRASIAQISSAKFTSNQTGKPT